VSGRSDLVVDGVELVEGRGGDRAIDIEDREARVRVQLRAVERGQVRDHLAGRVHALGERKGLDPGLDLLGPDLEVLLGGGAVRSA
jgi:hypothetical protein